MIRGPVRTRFDVRPGWGAYLAGTAQGDRVEVGKDLQCELLGEPDDEVLAVAGEAVVQFQQRRQLKDLCQCASRNDHEPMSTLARGRGPGWDDGAPHPT